MDTKFNPLTRKRVSGHASQKSFLLYFWIYFFSSQIDSLNYTSGNIPFSGYNTHRSFIPESDQFYIKT